MFIICTSKDPEWSKTYVFDKRKKALVPKENYLEKCQYFKKISREVFNGYPKTSQNIFAYFPIHYSASFSLKKIF